MDAVFFVLGIEVRFDFFVDFDISVPVASFAVVIALVGVLVDGVVVSGGVEAGFNRSVSFDVAVDVVALAFVLAIVVVDV